RPWGPRGAPRPSLDPPEGQLRTPRRGEDAPQPVHVLPIEPPVAGRRAGGRDQALGLEEPDLGHADVREISAELSKDLADAEVAAAGLGAHPRPTSLRRTRAVRPDPAGRRAGTCLPAPHHPRSAKRPLCAPGSRTS